MTTSYILDVQFARPFNLAAAAAPDAAPGAAVITELSPGVFEIQADGPYAIGFSVAPTFDSPRGGFEDRVLIAWTGGRIAFAALSGAATTVVVIPVLSVDEAWQRVRAPALALALRAGGTGTEQF